jgi:phosphohistidine phosphatase
MDVLILLRHGKAEREAADDKSRDLTDRGRRQAAEAGAAIAAEGLEPDRILVSGAARTRQTFAALQSSFGTPATFLDSLYMAPAQQIWNEAIRSGGKIVLVIGHNPGLQDLAADLARQSNDRTSAALSLCDHFPTSAFAAFSASGARMDGAEPTFISAWKPTS